jgi:hypothetical protein
MANKDLYIKYMKDKHGWRVTYDGDVYHPNPSVDKNTDTVTWHAPHNADAYIVFLPDSPFELPAGQRDVLHIEAGKSSKPFKLKQRCGGNKVYEYAALVMNPEKPADYTYVRGAESPPGVAVGP